MFKTSSSLKIYFSLLVKYHIYSKKTIVGEHFAEKGGCERATQPKVSFALHMCMDLKEKMLAFMSAKISYK